MVKKYKNQQLMAALTIIGAIVGLITLILGLAGIENYAFVDPLLTFNAIVVAIVGFVIVGITFWVGFKPNDPIPFHWAMLLILAILLIIFGAGIWACVLLVIAFLIGLIEDIS
ncbi:MAG: hypothetical protein ACXADU_05100 [Promethearchaeota archaeon]|jgi:hypothetical protein